MRLKGMHDIKTHGTLARQGKLISVVRNLYGLGGHERKGGNISDGWSVELHIFPKKKSTTIRAGGGASLHRELFLENKVRLHQIAIIQDLLQELLQATAEGILVAVGELERLIRRLAKLEVK